MFGLIPNQFLDALPFAKKLALKYHNYHITLVGHSLGATLAELSSIVLHDQGYNVNAVTIEGADCWHIAKHLTNTTDFSFIDSYLLHENFFNSFGDEHLGNLYHITPSHEPFWEQYFDIRTHRMIGAVDKAITNNNLIIQLPNEIQECDIIGGTSSSSLSTDPTQHLEL